ncbi:MAG: sigma-70 family RNA polymerase sigma factor, partial [Anaerolineaceae bacterium]|nr:sigma-70 family RNA polymerase sigma factor [Anaerolineaceae bacterium]
MKHKKSETAPEKIYTREEEFKIFEKIRAGEKAAFTLSKESLSGESAAQLRRTAAEGKAARDEFFENNINLAWSYIQKYWFSYISIRPDMTDELFSNCMLGLNRAIDKFDHKSGNKFSTYAFQWMRSFATVTTRSEWNILNYSNHVIENAEKYKKFCAEYRKESGKGCPDEKTAAKALNVSIATIRLAKQYLLSPVELDSPISDTSEALVGEFIHDNNDVEKDVDMNLMREYVREAFSVLTPREREAVRMFYGFTGIDRCVY